MLTFGQLFAPWALFTDEMLTFDPHLVRQASFSPDEDKGEDQGRTKAAAKNGSSPANQATPPARLGSARLGSARLGSARLGSARLGSARLGSARLGSARLGSARLGSARLGSANGLYVR
ncbi:hypothetical protein FFV09_13145 [Saccharibacillus brassicae]|uniref:Pentapeptide repeat-containing protein n=1 Tax=Saccharibacillus brassicae TaxID=2583377 RepID=A0A4Y6UZP2_SACBS|nr:hypothetical protein FFV09_13145 [Saccharibacillus brassicae]